MMTHEKIDVGVGHKASITIADGTDIDPQSLAMLQAFYSRSTMPIEQRVADVDGEAVREALAQYYLGYGHKSIGQCGNFTVFIEDVSIFAAKAIENHPLFNGQETSTRYVDFGTQPCRNPASIDGVQDHMRAVYVRATSYTQEALIERHKAENGGLEPTPSNLRAIRARAFDITRCLLTAGFTTKVSWTTNFDQCAEQLRWLINGPSTELKSLGLGLAEQLHLRYPKAMPAPETYAGPREAMFADVQSMYDVIASECRRSESQTEVLAKIEYLLPDIPRQDQMFLWERERGQPMPRHFTAYGTFTIATKLDYASWRDLHRHRNGIVYFPAYPHTRPMMHQWYVDEMASLGILEKPGLDNVTLGENISRLYSDLLPTTIERISRIYQKGTQEFDAMLMYYMPMGTLVPAVFRYDLPQAVYVAELRSGQTVHPTCRSVAKAIGHMVQSWAASRELDIPVHVSDKADQVSERRGEQTIFNPDGSEIK